MKNFWHFYLQTFQNIVKNSSVFTTMVLAILLYGFFYPTAYQAQHAEAIPIVIVDEEQSQLTQMMIQAASQSPNIHIKKITPQFNEAQNMLQNQQAEGMLYLPQNLSQSLRHGETGGIGLYLSAAYFLRLKEAGTGLAEALESVAAEYAAKYSQISHFEITPSIHKVTLFNPLSGYGSYIFPAVAPLIIHQTLLLGFTMLISSYREKKWRPSKTEFFAHFASAITIGCLGCFYLFGFIFWLYDYPRGGNFWGMLLTVPIYVSAVAAMSMLLASFLDMQERTGHLLVVSSIPLFLLSGIAWPHEAMPFIVQKLAWILPSTQGIQMFVQLNQMGVPTTIIVPKLAYLLGCMLIFLSFAYWRLVKVNSKQV
ncbi:ABC transporter permease [Acinetobacter sp. MD2(2019)]|uniref:ABC transporter permease n=1 Tax=Acinetobacter sp. MD2(2019) TaxID=2605273 RepID=UPI002D1EB318|nr:ABC transporter permease [Acinetobacter sp. MD2(2019)]MEB3753460.1 ABC transporter permease [Acinetobacter sp. MD2(2019)]